MYNLLRFGIKNKSRRRYNVEGSPCNGLKKTECNANMECLFVKGRGCRRSGRMKRKNKWNKQPQQSFPSFPISQINGLPELFARLTNDQVNNFFETLVGLSQDEIKELKKLAQLKPEEMNKKSSTLKPYQLNKLNKIVLFNPDEKAVLEKITSITPEQFEKTFQIAVDPHVQPNLEPSKLFSFGKKQLKMISHIKRDIKSLSR